MSQLGVVGKFDDSAQTCLPPAQLPFCESFPIFNGTSGRFGFRNAWLELTHCERTGSPMRSLATRTMNDVTNGRRAVLTPCQLRHGGHAFCKLVVVNSTPPSMQKLRSPLHSHSAVMPHTGGARSPYQWEGKIWC